MSHVSETGGKIPLAPARPLPVILVTGFLGAGKTTLLSRWLQDGPVTGKRLGIVMNEFGEVSVDSLIVSKPDLLLEQVSGGCICCAPDDELPRALTKMATADACDFVVVETSGLAEPEATIDALTDPDLLPVVRLQAVLTVVDARWYARPGIEAGERVLAKNQIRFANWLLLSKCDCVTEAEVEWVQSQLRELNPGAKMIRMPFALPELKEILAAEPIGQREGAGDGAGERDGAGHTHQVYKSLCFRLPIPVDRRQFEKFIEGISPREVARAKGFIRFNQSPGKLFLFQSVMGYHLIDEFKPSAKPDPVIVLIGPALDLEKFRGQLRSLMGDGKSMTILKG